MQRNLLDTHTLIWYLNGDSELSEKARAIIESDNAVNFVSIVSLWEIAIKISLGKLELQLPFSEIGLQIEKNGLKFYLLLFRTHYLFQIYLFIIEIHLIGF